MFIFTGGQNIYVSPFYSAGSAAAEAGGTTWTNAANILTDDGSEAGYTDPKPDATTKDLYAYNWGIVVPPHAVILEYIPKIRIRATTDVTHIYLLSGSAGHYSAGTFTALAGGGVSANSGNKEGTDFTLETEVVFNTGTQNVTAADVNASTFCICFTVLTTSGIYSPDVLVDYVALRLKYRA